MGYHYGSAKGYNRPKSDYISEEFGEQIRKVERENSRKNRFSKKKKVMRKKKKKLEFAEYIYYFDNEDGEDNESKKCSLSFKHDNFLEWFNEQKKNINRSGYLVLTVMWSKKKGKHYIVVNTCER